MWENFSSFAVALALIGTPSVFGMTVWCVRFCRNIGKKIEVLMEAQQKQMARDLTIDYKEYIRQGYIETEDLEIWEANYQKYHLLGANGVMDNKRSKLMALPNIPPTQRMAN